MKPITLRKVGRSWQVLVNVDEAKRRSTDRRAREYLASLPAGAVVPVAKLPDGKLGLVPGGTPHGFPSKADAMSVAGTIGEYRLRVGEAMLAHAFVEEEKSAPAKVAADELAPLPSVKRLSAADRRQACRKNVGRAAARARVACEAKASRGEDSNPRQTDRYMTPRPCRSCGARTSALAKRTAGGSLDESGPVFYDTSGKSGTFGGLAVRCSGCGEPRAVKAVSGVVNRSVECDAKCQASRGFKCECSCGGKNHGSSYAAARNPAPKAPRARRVVVANPQGTLYELGLLTKLTYRNGRGELVELVWTLKDAPILAHDDADRLFVVYRGKVTRAATPAEIEKYRRMHWGAKARGKVTSGVFATAPLRRLGVSESIVYTTIKGGDGAKTDYRHVWGDGARGRWIAPTVYVHKCGARGCTVEEAIALGGGNYTVETHGIVG